MKKEIESRLKLGLHLQSADRNVGSPKPSSLKSSIIGTNLPNNQGFGGIRRQETILSQNYNQNSPE